MIASLLALVALALPPVLELPYSSVAVAYVEDILPIGAPDGRPDLFIQEVNGNAHLLEFDRLEFYDEFFQVLLDSSTTLTTTFTDAEGDTYTVTTDCKAWVLDDEGLALCTAFHAKAVAAMKKLFPKSEVDEQEPRDILK